MQNRVELFPHDLSGWLDGLPPSVRVLSLDCFDTLVWRGVASPHDVFYALQESPAWRENRIRAYHRIQAEAAARKELKAVLGRSEPSLADIYRHMLPCAAGEVIDACVRAEWHAELQACFVFAPALELISRAFEKGLRVAVLSDTYWRAEQLRELILALHDHPVLHRLEVFTSCDAGCGKSDGIWPSYLQMLRIKADQVYHLGDNPVADVQGPANHGIQGVLLRQHDAVTQRHLEDFAQASVQLMPDLRQDKPLPSVFRSILAQRLDPQWSAQRQLGYRTLGPVFFAFATFIREQLKALADESDAPVRKGFLMRDGHLPGQAYRTLTGESDYCPLHISRFTANAASLYEKADVLKLLAITLGKKSLEPALRQLLFSDDEVREILRRSGSQVSSVRSYLVRDDTMRLILDRASQIRQRMLEHVRTRTGLQPGETLVLIDLGYSGTVQGKIRSVLRKEMDVSLKAIYLLAFQPGPEDSDRVGLVGLPWAEERLVSALIAHIGIFELLCTKAEPSTVDYTPSGEPVYGDGGVKSQQSRTVEVVQEACLNFIRDALAADSACLPDFDVDGLARQTAGEIARLIYLPSPQEVRCLSSFEFDFNLGTDLMLQAADLESGVREFRREGFSSLNKDFTTWRVNAPMELRYMDVSLANTLFSATRFGFDVRQSDASMRGIRFPVLIAKGQDHSITHVDSFTTIDGFHVLHLPCSASFDMSVLWGQVLSAVQVEAIERVPLAQHTIKDVIDASAQVVLDGSDAWTSTVQGLRAEAMLFVPRCSAEFHGSHLLRVVARPLELRPVA